MNILKKLFNPVPQARTCKQVAEGVEAKHLELPPGFKFKSTEQTIEIDLGENDIIIFRTERLLSTEQRDKMIEQWARVKEAKGPICMVLDAGITYSIIHRESKAE